MKDEDNIMGRVCSVHQNFRDLLDIGLLLCVALQATRERRMSVIFRLLSIQTHTSFLLYHIRKHNTKHITKTQYNNILK